MYGATGSLTVRLALILRGSVFYQDDPDDRQANANQVKGAAPEVPSHPPRHKA